MAEVSIDQALDALNTGRAYLSPEAAELFIYGDNMGVDALLVSDRPGFTGDPEVRMLGYGKEQMWK